MKIDSKKSRKKNLYFYRWDREYLEVSMQAERITCSIRDFDYDDNLEDYKKLRSCGVEVAVALPVLWDAGSEHPFDAVSELISCVYVGNVGQISVAKDLNVPLIGDVGLNFCNSRSAEFLIDVGFQGGTLSYELERECEDVVNELRSTGRLNLFSVEGLIYGRVPAMISEYCPLAGAEGVKGDKCGKCAEFETVFLKEEHGERYPVLLDDTSCTSLILSKSALNRKGTINSLIKHENLWERICVFDESPSFLARI